MGAAWVTSPVEGRPARTVGAGGVGVGDIGNEGRRDNAKVRLYGSRFWEGIGAYSAENQPEGSRMAHRAANRVRPLCVFPALPPPG